MGRINKISKKWSSRKKVRVYSVIGLVLGFAFFLLLANAPQIPVVEAKPEGFLELMSGFFFKLWPISAMFFYLLTWQEVGKVKHKKVVAVVSLLAFVLWLATDRVASSEPTLEKGLELLLAALCAFGFTSLQLDVYRLLQEAEEQKGVKTG